MPIMRSANNGEALLWARRSAIAFGPGRDVMTKNAYGDHTLAVLDSLETVGVERAALIMRHSAREYVAGRHDLANPLTDAGRAYARNFGERLGSARALRAYSSPAGRCVETAELICQGQNASPGARVRPVEALGVFYALDQQRMFKAMSEIRMNLPNFVVAWQAGDLAEDIMMNAEQAAMTLLRLLWVRLRARPEGGGRRCSTFMSVTTSPCTCYGL